MTSTQWRRDLPVAPEPDSKKTAFDWEALEVQLQAAERRAEAAEQARDWWMAQHDAVMKDWRLDIAILHPKGFILQPAFTPRLAPPEPPPLAAEPAPLLLDDLVSGTLILTEPIGGVMTRAMPTPVKPVLTNEALQFLVELLHFFDHRTGGIVFQRNGGTLSEVFGRASSWMRNVRP